MEALLPSSVQFQLASSVKKQSWIFNLNIFGHISTISSWILMAWKAKFVFFSVFLFLGLFYFFLNLEFFLLLIVKVAQICLSGPYSCCHHVVTTFAWYNVLNNFYLKFDSEELILREDESFHLFLYFDKLRPSPSSSLAGLSCAVFPIPPTHSPGKVYFWASSQLGSWSQLNKC